MMPIKTDNVLAATFEWFTRAIAKPTDKNLHVQLGVHFEEVGEMVHEMYSKDADTAALVAEAERAINALATHLKKSEDVVFFKDRGAVLDSICDQIVTATGVGYMMGMDPVGGLAEVNRSNWSKFVNGMPQFDAQGKIMKAGDYSKPNLDPFV